MKLPACLAFVALAFAAIHDSSAQSNPQPVREYSAPLPVVEVHPDRTVLPADQVEPSAPQTVGPGFQTLSLQDQFSAFSTGSIPPDTMGAIGPQHFVQVINGSVAIYNRTNGTRLSHVTLNAFFTATFDDVLYPRTRAFDPRVLYDRRSGRWFASAVEEGDPSRTENHVLLAVSETSDPTGAWYKYLIPFGEPDDGSTTFFTDYATLGTDDNGVYLAARIFPSSDPSFAKIAAMRKSPLLGGSAATITFFSDITDMFSVPQPANNFDPLDPSDPTWFVASSPFAAPASGHIYYRTLTWSGDTPILDSSSEFLSSPEVGTLPDAPASGSDTDLETGDKRLLMAAIRNNRLWTCRTIGVDSGGNAGDSDRTACEWFELDLSGGTPSIVQRGRVFDGSSDPFFYYYPSIMVNGQGHAAMGFSGSRGDTFISAYFTGRLANDAADSMGVIELLKAGEAAYERLDGAEPPRNRWGDYSYTSLDPNNDMTLWTIQEYAENSSFNDNVWGTWVSPLFAPAPTFNNPLIASAAQGDTAVTVTLTGTGFYDPGDPFPARLNVTLSGGSPNGISNYSVSYLNPTEAEVTFDIDPAAETGFRDIVLTNPDGQSATAIDAFEILSTQVDIGVTLSADPNPVLVGEPLVYTITVTNHEPLTAGNVVAINTLPPEVSFISASSTLGDCNHADGIVTCELGNLPGSTDAILTITVSPDTAGSLTNSILLASSTEDPNPADNSAEAIVTATPVADLLLSLTDAPDPVNLGAGLTYTITVINQGPSPATDVVINNPLPDEVVFDSATSSQGTVNHESGVVTAELGTLETGADAMITVQVTAVAAGNASNEASVASAEFDPDTEDNTASTETFINSPPDVSFIGNQTIDEDTSLTGLSFTLDDLETAPEDLIVTALTGNPDLIPMANLVLGGTGSERTLDLAPAPDQHGSTLVAVQVSDGIAVTAVSFTVTVQPVNDPPTLTGTDDRTLDELTLLSIPFEADDIDGDLLAFSLGEGAPEGAVIDPETGVFTWTPTEEQGPSTHTIEVIVTDNGSPQLADSTSFEVIVREVNQPPVITAIPDAQTDEEVEFVLTPEISDPDIPANELTFSLDLAPPEGLSLDSGSGVITWTPTEAQGPSTNTIALVITDDGVPSLSSTQTFVLTVLEVNITPTLQPFEAATIPEGSELSITASATDSDLPANNLTFSLEDSPAGAAIDPETGVFTWTPDESQGPGNYDIQIVVSDDGDPILSATETLSVEVTEVNEPPVLAEIPDATFDEQTEFTFTPEASDPDLPANELSFSLDSEAPEGLTLDPQTGVITWTPTESQGPSTNALALVVTDNGVPSFSATQTFVLTVLEVNSAPVLAAIPDATFDEQTEFTFTPEASDPDLPANELTFSLDSEAPEGLTLDPQTGVITWTPTEAQGPSTNAIALVVTDNGVPFLSATQTFVLTVLEMNSAPVLTAIPDTTFDEQTEFAVTPEASDPDLPANELTFSLDSEAPEGLTLDPQTGVTTWTPTEAQGPSTNTIALVVTDNGMPSLSATQTFVLTIREVNTAPVLTAIADRTLSPGETLELTVQATDDDLPANDLTFALDPGAPTGMTLDPTSGLLSWEPSANDAGITHSVTIRVTDDGTPELDDSIGFSVIVEALNIIELTGLRLDNDGFHLQVTGDPGLTYTLEASTNLDQWDTVQTITPDSSTFEFLDPDAVFLPRRYYRVLVE